MMGERIPENEMNKQLYWYIISIVAWTNITKGVLNENEPSKTDILS